MPPSPRRIKSKTPKGFGCVAPYGVYIGLLREWCAMSHPHFKELRERTKKVLGE